MCSLILVKKLLFPPSAVWWVSNIGMFPLLQRCDDRWLSLELTLKLFIFFYNITILNLCYYLNSSKFWSYSSNSDLNKILLCVNLFRCSSNWSCPFNITQEFTSENLMKFSQKCLNDFKILLQNFFIDNTSFSTRLFSILWHNFNSDKVFLRLNYELEIFSIFRR